ncbi:hypothetical protein RUND412_010542 [Rhizina undulata]
MSALLRTAVAKKSFVTTAASSSKNLRIPLFRYLHASAVMAAPKFQEGQKVEYHPIGGAHGTSTSTGVIKRVLTEPDHAGSTGVTVKASPDDPRYEIQNDKTGKTSAVKEGNIERVID